MVRLGVESDDLMPFSRNAKAETNLSFFNVRSFGQICARFVDRCAGFTHVSHVTVNVLEYFSVFLGTRCEQIGIWIHTMAAMACNHQAINGLSLGPLTRAKTVALKTEACSSRQKL